MLKNTNAAKTANRIPDTGELEAQAEEARDAYERAKYAMTVTVIVQEPTGRDVECMVLYEQDGRRGILHKYHERMSPVKGALVSIVDRMRTLRLPKWVPVRIRTNCKLLVELQKQRLTMAKLDHADPVWWCKLGDVLGRLGVWIELIDLTEPGTKHLTFEALKAERERYLSAKADKRKWRAEKTAYAEARRSK